MKKGLLLIFTLFLSIAGYAYDIAVENEDGVTIYYNYYNNGTELQVTYKKSDYRSYSGVVNIPEEITYMSRTRKVTSIGEAAFSDCSGLTSVTIPNSVTTIGRSAFKNCKGLTSVTIPNSVTSIGRNTFSGCKGLTSVTIGNSVTSIGEEAFSDCSGLTSITIPNSVTSIGDYAFWGCSGLTSVTIPNSVTTIGDSTFRGCDGLTSVTIPNSVTSIGDYAFSGCDGLTSVTIPNSVTSIGSFAFWGCDGLTSVSIPNSVTSIGVSAFSDCSGLTSVTIPNSVTTIGRSAFSGCSGLTSVVSKMENPCSIYGNCFDQDVFYNVTLYVPKGTTEKYKSTQYWYKFLFMVEGDPESGTQPEVKKCSTPTISYSNKRLAFSCETEGVEFFYEIKDTDIKNGNGAIVDLSATYEISVYATKSGYENSNMATATLVWTEAIFTETTVPPASAKAIRESFPALISANSGNITVKSEANGQAVTAYTIDGQFLGNATISNGQAVVPTTLQKGTVTIVKIGNKSVKIVMQ